MAVVTKYVVVRNGVELEPVFMVKKDAEAYDRMLDAADNLAAYIRGGELTIGLDDAAIDAISVFLAKNGPDVIRILKGLKPVAVPSPGMDAQAGDDAPAAVSKKKKPTARAKTAEN